MIFSFSDDTKEFELVSAPDVDVFCFFHVESAVHCPKELWFESISTSLRMKKSVLLLEKEIQVFPAWDKARRWQVGDGWVYLAPRAYSPIKEAKKGVFTDFQSFKTFLTNSK